ncbi:L-carnitine dehydratase/bile acid-inducible protein F [Geomicrobium sp. JCM 19037]|uniref:CaiB/BaiF CoA transferase family protein n=1 Tax=Geomicrobium sp. JCM 19037 TaxID=1460634 RepID=UPI00045F1F48|nr:CaiB/BaiF CoA-transferase family protein [Geomicrobium sp. JCM 19037]GAK04328.1 L-carnitine dehydratase/bile acid-inducible protein F [Geomicrobium sp. JCM 19037]
MLPLEGITVVSIEQAVAAPFASRQLADLGARVIKVERPEVGDFARNYDDTVQGMSSFFTWLNRSKESAALDLKDDESREFLTSMLSKADVFLHNLAPGAIDRLGFQSDELREKFPQLITCSISGYGESGSYMNKKAYDLLIQCEAGAVSVTGTKETPSKTGISIADISAGMYAFSGVLSAIIARGQTGKGTHLEISMLETLGEWMGYPMYYEGIGGKKLNRTGASHASIFPYGPFPTEDRTIFIGIQNNREWQVFCEQILEDDTLYSDSRFLDNAQRVENQEILRSIIEQKLQTVPAAEVIEKLDRAKIANANLNDMKAFKDHPQLKDRNRWTQVDSPVGLVDALLPPINSKDFDVVMKPIPKVGEHTGKLREEFTITK